MFATLGQITFEALGSPETFESSREYSYVEHKVVESSPLLQWMAEELETISLDMLLHVAFAQPLTDLATIRAAASAHQAMALVLGNGVHRGYFVITKIAETARQLADDGSIIALSLKVELKQWARSVEVDPNAPPVPSFTPPAIVIGPLAPGQSVAGAVSTSGAVTFPKNQAGTSAIVSNPPSPAPSAPQPAADNVPVTSIWRMDTSVGGVLQ